MLPTAMTAASVNDFAHPAGLSSPPPPAAYPPARAHRCYLAAPAERSRVTSSPSSSGFSTILAS